jgi:hypothetical protein
MKNLFFLFLTIMSGCSSHAQNTATQESKQVYGEPSTATYAMPVGKKAVLKLPFARNIIVKIGDQATLQFTTTIQATNEEIKQLHTMNVVEDKDQLRIETNLKKEGFGKSFNCCWCHQCDSTLVGSKSKASKWEQNCICFRVDYTIILPAETSLNIETISGDIEIKGSTGELRAKTISGFVDIDRPIKTSSELSFHSVTGEIYTDFDIPLSKNSTSYNKTVSASLNGGGKNIWAESISGDIFFRKRSED